MSIQRLSAGPGTTSQPSGEPDLPVGQPLVDENLNLGPSPQYECMNADDPAKAWVNPED